MWKLLSIFSPFYSKNKLGFFFLWLSLAVFSRKTTEKSIINEPWRTRYFWPLWPSSLFRTVVLFKYNYFSCKSFKKASDLLRCQDTVLQRGTRYDFISLSSSLQENGGNNFLLPFSFLSRMCSRLMLTFFYHSFQQKCLQHWVLFFRWEDAWEKERKSDEKNKPFFSDISPLMINNQKEELLSVKENIAIIVYMFLYQEKNMKGFFCLFLAVRRDRADREKLSAGWLIIHTPFSLVFEQFSHTYRNEWWFFILKAKIQGVQLLELFLSWPTVRMHKNLLLFLSTDDSIIIWWISISLRIYWRYFIFSKEKKRLFFLRFFLHYFFLFFRHQILLHVDDCLMWRETCVFERNCEQKNIVSKKLIILSDIKTEISLFNLDVI